MAIPQNSLKSYRENKKSKPKTPKTEEQKHQRIKRSHLVRELMKDTREEEAFLVALSGRGFSKIQDNKV